MPPIPLKNKHILNSYSVNTHTHENQWIVTQRPFSNDILGRIDPAYALQEVLAYIYPQMRHSGMHYLMLFIMQYNILWFLKTFANTSTTGLQYIKFNLYYLCADFLSLFTRQEWNSRVKIKIKGYTRAYSNQFYIHVSWLSRAHLKAWRDLKVLILKKKSIKTLIVLLWLCVWIFTPYKQMDRFQCISILVASLCRCIFTISQLLMLINLYRS